MYLWGTALTVFDVGAVASDMGVNPTFSLTMTLGLSIPSGGTGIDGRSCHTGHHDSLGGDRFRVPATDNSPNITRKCRMPY